MKKIAIGAITRERPKMLELLLDSFSKLKIPENCVIIFVIVENNDELKSEVVINKFRSKVPENEVFYELQPTMGIPFARNKVLDIALRENSDFLTFVDDDEVVDKDWFCELYEVLQSRQLDLIGGPVRLTPTDSTNLLNRMIHRGLVNRNKGIEEKTKSKVDQGIDKGLPIITSNWMVNLEFARKTGVRFDESLGYSGGSDVIFCNQAKKHGAKTGWASKAIVYEEMPPKRLTPGYQFARTRDQGIASFHRKYPKNTPKVYVSSACFILAKFSSVPGLLIIALFNRGASVTQASRAAGYAWGRYLALTGKKSDHYKKVHGA